MRIALVTLWLCVLAGAAPLTADSDPIATEAQATLDTLRDQMGFPGATLAVELPDGRHFSLATGLADVERHLAMRPHDRLMSGSIGKNFVAAIALRLADIGEVRLDQPLVAWMPEVEGFDRVPNAEQLTLRHLLAHTSGVPEWIDAGVRETLREKPTKVWSAADRLEAIAGGEPLFAAGEGFEYTDANYILAGIVLEAATGRSYESLLAELLEELELDSTEPSDRPTLDGLVPGYSFTLERYGIDDLAPEVTVGGRRARQVVTDQTLVFNPQIEWTGGGLVTTSADLARWIHRLFTGRVLTEAALDQLTSDPNNLGYPGYDYGLGLEMGQFGSVGPARGHTGFFPGYQSATLHFPDHGFSIATQINSDHPETSDTIRVVLAIAEALVAALAESTASANDEVAVRKVIDEYVEGWREGDVVRLSRIFETEYGHIIWRSVEDDETTVRSMTFAEALEKRRPNDGYGQPYLVESVDIVDGVLAVVRFTVERAGKGSYVDYFTLYKISDGWKIVTKAFAPRPGVLLRESKGED